MFLNIFQEVLFSATVNEKYMDVLLHLTAYAIMEEFFFIEIVGLVNFQGCGKLPF